MTGFGSLSCQPVAKTLATSLFLAIALWAFERLEFQAAWRAGDQWRTAGGK